MISMSMMGFAQREGTEVLPTCSIVYDEEEESSRRKSDSA